MIWHENIMEDTQHYYETTDYRKSVDHNFEVQKFYKEQDEGVIIKLNYTGTGIFRDKVVADIGAASGVFLMFLQGVARKLIGIEPTKTFRDIMNEKGIQTFPYTHDAKAEYIGKIDVITSFDVIEHVENPKEFLQDVYDLLSPGGRAIIGTPTDAPVMRGLLGNIYEQMILYSTQHLWIFSQESLACMAKTAGFQKYTFKYYQRYGLSNLLSWIQYRKPMSVAGENSSMYHFITPSLDQVYRKELARENLGDFIIIYLEK